jgi:two-component system NarL family sensor kinase
VTVAVFAIAVLVVPAGIRDEVPAEGAELAFYESVFAIAALATALMVGRLRTAESASRLRARGVSRRTIQAESEVRRRVAEAIHDGPVQELIGLDMVLSAARRASEEGDTTRALEMIAEAHGLAKRNIQALRDEIVDLGPYAFEELAFDTAIENCLPTWKRRYGFEVLATLQRLRLPPEVAGDLFRITQEAVVNAGRHAQADAVSISLRTVEGELELRITDDGRGFGDGDPLSVAEPGHLGLASMRERAELLGGRLNVDTSQRGTRVLVRVPLPEGARLTPARAGQ